MATDGFQPASRLRDQRDAANLRGSDTALSTDEQ